MNLLEKRGKLENILNLMLEEKENKKFNTLDDVKKVEEEFLRRLFK